MSDLKKATDKILEQRNIKPRDWEKSVIEKAQIDFLRRNDKEIEFFVLERERQNLILEKIEKL